VDLLQWTVGPFQLSFPLAQTFSYGTTCVPCSDADCCYSHLHSLELLRQAQEKDANSGQ